MLSVLGNAIRLGGIAAPLLIPNLSLISWPLGRIWALYPFFSSERIESLYGASTRRLLALGQGVGDNHHTQLIASFTRIRRMFTHSAGVGNFEGFHQKKSCAK